VPVDPGVVGWKDVVPRGARGQRLNGPREAMCMLELHGLCKRASMAAGGERRGHIFWAPVCTGRATSLHKPPAEYRLSGGASQACQRCRCLTESSSSLSPYGTRGRQRSQKH
jgi:hypothetical protein